VLSIQDLRKMGKELKACKVKKPEGRGERERGEGEGRRIEEGGYRREGGGRREGSPLPSLLPLLPLLALLPLILLKYKLSYPGLFFLFMAMNDWVLRGVN
jgi:hypothetical protein